MSRSGKIAGITVHPQPENHAGHIIGARVPVKALSAEFSNKHKFSRILQAPRREKESAECDFVIILFPAPVSEYSEGATALLLHRPLADKWPIGFIASTLRMY